MNPITRRLAASPSQWLADLVDNRRPCPARGCERGMVAVVTERPSRWYPGAAEERPCERCGGLGYLPHQPRKATLRGTVPGWAVSMLSESHIGGYEILAGMGLAIATNAAALVRDQHLYADGFVARRMDDGASRLAALDRLIRARVNRRLGGAA